MIFSISRMVFSFRAPLWPQENRGWDWNFQSRMKCSNREWIFQARMKISCVGEWSGKSRWRLSNWGLRELVHDCPRLSTILWRKFPLKGGPKRPQKCTIVDDCAQIAESGLKPHLRAPSYAFQKWFFSCVRARLIFFDPRALWGQKRAFVPDTGRVPIFPEGFLPEFSKDLGLKPTFVSPRLDSPHLRPTIGLIFVYPRSQQDYTHLLFFILLTRKLHLHFSNVLN